MAVKQKVSTCLWYTDTAEDAAKLYVSLFANSRLVSVSRYAEGGMMPAGTAMLVRFELGGTEFAALNGGDYFKLSEAASLVVSCEDQAEIDRLWDALVANGGSESQCGWLKDRYGLSWQILPEAMEKLTDPGDPKRAARVWNAIMPMKKIDLATLEHAYRG
jgi:predicted 3-demethylubiquinone-9 3-methyltransferase (glyoxalase superfamily)